MGVNWNALRLKHQTTVPTPNSDEIALYPKNDGALYMKNGLGVERAVTSVDTALHSNASFELGASAPGTDWQLAWATGHTASFDTTEAIEGTRSLKIIWGAGAATHVGRSVDISVVAGSVVEISAWVRASVAGTLNIHFFTAPTANQADFFGTGAAQQTAPVALSTLWTRVSAQFTVPTGHSFMRFYLSGPDNRTIWYDATGSRVVSTPPVPDDTGWIGPTFLNSWINFDANRVVQYKRLNGWVKFRGIAKNGTVGLSMFDVPVGFRPINRGSTAEQHFPVVSNGAFGFFQVWHNGAIVLAAGSNAYADLSPITYEAAV